MRLALHGCDGRKHRLALHGCGSPDTTARSRCSHLPRVVIPTARALARARRDLSLIDRGAPAYVSIKAGVPRPRLVVPTTRLS